MGYDHMLSEFEKLCILRCLRVDRITVRGGVRVRVGGWTFGIVCHYFTVVLCMRVHVAP